MKIIEENMDLFSELEAMMNETTHINIAMIPEMIRKALNELEESFREGTACRNFNEIPDKIVNSINKEENVDIENLQSVLEFLSTGLSVVHENTVSAIPGV